MRAAMVGGAAYAVGKHVQSGRDEEAAQDEQYDETQEEEAPAPSGGITDAQIDELQKLADLNKQGILTDDEFAAQKQKILEGS